MSTVPSPRSAELAPHARAAADQAVTYARGADAPNTRRAYAVDWRDWSTWCDNAGVVALPAAPEAVGAYLASMARTHALATLRRRLAAISRAHRQAGQHLATSHPAIRDTLRGIAREHGVPQRRAAAIGTAEIRRLVATCTDGLTGTRDRALLLLGFAGALRRSELVAVEREHLTFTPEGLRVRVPRSKGDPEGQGQELGIARGQHRATCPVRAMEAWLEVSGCQFGPVFRAIDRWGGIESCALHPGAVRRILLRRAEEAGIEGTALEPIAPHGLRAGFVTQAYQAGLRDEEIMEHSRHRDLKTMRRYVRRAKLMQESPTKRLGL
ncbi:tyrosine-type recombinase/integrase [Paracraurococcus lichenis]|uniref:Tyrosine-type recombinase/integrase n=1 Tax=Paracraurococcus lichenis TaxID=3064888 RepID=A0ABT9E8I3_9PROT|nr:tyrosine-type recombinase/integrase [Paracraurococcus sp. LOR1-02]MDO9712489.1 tyrosine-type recombinase/integrase [Paracraurococcus sp. LOR1-02]